eukprot:gene9106-biopygen13617
MRKVPDAAAAREGPHPHDDEPRLHPRYHLALAAPCRGPRAVWAAVAHGDVPRREVRAFGNGLTFPRSWWMVGNISKRPVALFAGDALLSAKGPASIPHTASCLPIRPTDVALERVAELLAAQAAFSKQCGRNYVDEGLRPRDSAESIRLISPVRHAAALRVRPIRVHPGRARATGDCVRLALVPDLGGPPLAEPAMSDRSNHFAGRQARPPRPPESAKAAGVAASGSGGLGNLQEDRTRRAARNRGRAAGPRLPGEHEGPAPRAADLDDPGEEPVHRLQLLVAEAARPMAVT